MTKKLNTDNAIIVLNAGSSSLKFGLYCASNTAPNTRPHCFTQGNFSNIDDADGATTSFEIRQTKPLKPILEPLAQIKTHR